MKKCIMCLVIMLSYLMLVGASDCQQEVTPITPTEKIINFGKVTDVSYITVDGGLLSSGRVVTLVTTDQGNKFDVGWVAPNGPVQLEQSICRKQSGFFYFQGSGCP